MEEQTVEEGQDQRAEKRMGSPISFTAGVEGGWDFLYSEE